MASSRKRAWKRKNKKLWAEGAREDLLKPHIEAYTDTLERGWRAERDYCQKVCNEYHARISWRLADEDEPELPLPDYDEFAPWATEELTEEEEIERQARIEALNVVRDHPSQNVMPRVSSSLTYSVSVAGSNTARAHFDGASPRRSMPPTTHLPSSWPSSLVSSIRLRLGRHTSNICTSCSPRQSPPW
jgi:hypothetical protein